MTQAGSVVTDELRRLAQAIPQREVDPKLAAEILRMARGRRRGSRGRLIVSFAVLLLIGSIAATVPGRNPRFAMTQPSASMQPVIMVGERVEFDRRLQPLRGDVVVARVDNGGESETIRRVIAVGQDTVECPAAAAGRCRGVMVNGSLVDEPYLPDETVEAFGPVVVPRGTVFLLGDNRNNSIDSRQLGPVEQTAVTGIAVAILGADGTRRPIPGAPERPEGEGLVDPPAPVPPARAATTSERP